MHAPLVDATPGICELQKMYFLTEVRGLGLGKILLQHLLAHATSLGYTQCYLETLHTMEKANMLYKKCGFMLLEQPLGDTGHYNCDAWYLKKL